jgi:low affinity Fe/Cu permease
MDSIFTKIATWVSWLTGQPAAFLLAIAIVLTWGVTGPVFGFSDTWQLVINTGTTIVTFLMVFLIQNSQNRDAAAMQAKLDEVIRSLDKARHQFIGIEHLTDNQIEKIRAALEAEAEHENDGAKKAATVEGSVERLLDRY